MKITLSKILYNYKYHLFLLFTILFFISNNSYAKNLEEQTKSVEIFFNAQTQNIIDNLKSRKTVEEQRIFLVNFLAKLIDIDYISYNVLARNAKKLTPEQKQQFIVLYKKYLTYLYAPHFKGYGNEKFKIVKINKLPIRKYKGQMIEMYKLYTEMFTIRKPNTPININFYFHKRYKSDKREESQYKLFNIEVEGISLLYNHRQEFANLLSQSGVKVFIQTLEQRILALQKPTK